MAYATVHAAACAAISARKDPDEHEWQRLRLAAYVLGEVQDLRAGRGAE